MSQIRLAHREHLREVFDHFDGDCDGAVSTRDLRAVMKMLSQPISDSDLARMVAQIDLNEKGELDLEGFCKLMCLQEFD